MNTTSDSMTSLTAKLDSINMSEIDRIVAQAYVARGEFVAEMLIRGAKAIGAFVQGIGRGIVTLFRPRQLS